MPHYGVVIHISLQMSRHKKQHILHPFCFVQPKLASSRCLQISSATSSTYEHSSTAVASLVRLLVLSFVRFCFATSCFLFPFPKGAFVAVWSQRGRKEESAVREVVDRIKVPSQQSDFMAFRGCASSLKNRRSVERGCVYWMPVNGPLIRNSATHWWRSYNARSRDTQLQNRRDDCQRW